MGAEFLIGAEPREGLIFEGQISLLDPRDTSAGRVTKNDILPYLSRATGMLRGAYEWLTGRDGDLQNISVGFRTYFQSSRYGDPAGLGVIPGQTFTDLELGAVLHHDVFHVRGRVCNVFDAEGCDVVGFPLPGRGAFLCIEAKL
jgi:iron complex outermembrane receptor protein